MDADRRRGCLAVPQQLDPGRRAVNAERAGQREGDIVQVNADRVTYKDFEKVPLTEGELAPAVRHDEAWP